MATSGSVRRSASGSQGGSLSVDQAHFDLGSAPPVLKGPESVLELLRVEVGAKFGKRAAKSVPLELTKVLRGQVTNVILRKYEPEIVLAMIRLLVWDWEVARGVCWPPQKDAKIPDVLSLVKWAGDLATRLESGFKMPSRSRGKHNTYKNLFVLGREWLDDSNPF